MKKPNILGIDNNGKNNVMIDVSIETTPLVIAARTGIIVGYTCIAASFISMAVGNSKAAVGFGNLAIASGISSAVMGAIALIEHVEAPKIECSIKTL